ncbi:MAG: hypothetical protein QOG09_818 [Solirubrobacterales bacterium]|jgi:uncharacterized protein (TIGR00369 family)|nr:hypothetical protein [Solirubrobacterales bacterium]
MADPASDDGPSGIDGLSRWLGLRWDAHDRVRLTIRDDLINPAGLLAGGVTYAMVDYCMGSTLWRELDEDERIATIGISIDYVQTAREGDVICTTQLDRRNDRVGIMRSEVHHEDGRLLANAIGSFSIFPRSRLKGQERR